MFKLRMNILKKNILYMKINIDYNTNTCKNCCRKLIGTFWNLKSKNGLERIGTDWNELERIGTNWNGLEGLERKFIGTFWNLNLRTD